MSKIKFTGEEFTKALKKASDLDLLLLHIAIFEEAMRRKTRVQDSTDK